MWVVSSMNEYTTSNGSPQGVYINRSISPDEIEYVSPMSYHLSSVPNEIVVQLVE